jgi:hypothetical protein
MTRKQRSAVAVATTVLSLARARHAATGASHVSTRPTVSPVSRTRAAMVSPARVGTVTPARMGTCQPASTTRDGRSPNGMRAGGAVAGSIAGEPLRNR